ncbi:hypothetical protein SAMN05216388_10013 [Halorientalis persicus]|uniref:Uncharacterized protein n=1 Tax=Halorientalis persicus TaxID=1367881 RepID=A0A1H8CJI6_9EURY|nr:hypothetical protein SAMN05216388_10013 [Halorientalis persicus]
MFVSEHFEVILDNLLLFFREIEQVVHCLADLRFEVVNVRLFHCLAVWFQPLNEANQE